MLAQVVWRQRSLCADWSPARGVRPLALMLWTSAPFCSSRSACRAVVGVSSDMWRGVPPQCVLPAILGSDVGSLDPEGYSHDLCVSLPAGEMQRTRAVLDPPIRAVLGSALEDLFHQRSRSPTLTALMMSLCVNGIDYSLLLLLLLLRSIRRLRKAGIRAGA